MTHTDKARGPGFFGKLPGQGDFVGRRLPADFVRVWDAWLQAALQESKSALGEDWLEIYLTSPIWRFVLVSDVAGPSAWAGLLMPSVDRVGRYFPLTVASALPGLVHPFDVLRVSEAWFDQAQSLMLAALEQAWAPDRLEQALVSLGSPPRGEPSGKAAAPSGEPCEEHQEQRARRFGVPCVAQLHARLNDVLEECRMSPVCSQTLWWTEGSDRLAPSLLTRIGLPEQTAYVALMTGDWEAGGWQDFGDAEESGGDAQSSVDVADLFSVSSHSTGPADVAPNDSEPEADMQQRSGASAMSDKRDELKLASAGCTHPGRVRAINQDAFLNAPDRGLWVVADGMGGHAAGEHAAQLVVRELAAMPSPRAPAEAIEQIEQALTRANQQLLQDAQSRAVDVIGSTVVVLQAVGTSGVIAWVGDSRIYRLRDGVLERLTTDHTEVQEWVEQGRLSEEAAEHHPLGHVLARAVGAEELLQVDHRINLLRPGDRYLLCSDGVTKELGDELLRQLLSTATLSACSSEIVGAACDAGGRDNATAVIVELLEKPQPVVDRSDP